MSFELRPLSEVEDALLAAAWDEAFAPRTRSAEEWRHLRGDGATARLEAVAALEDGAVAACYGALSVRGICQGNPTRLGQVVDSFVVPRLRGTLAGARTLVQAGRAYFERYGARDATAVHYGWPVEAVRPLGEAQLGYLPLRREVVLYAELGAEEAQPAEVRAAGAYDARFDALWERLAPARAVAVVHDAAFLAWRTREHPRRSYECLCVPRADGSLAGAVVLASGEAWHPGTVALADWLVPEDEGEAARLLVAAARARAAAAGAKLLLALVPTRSGAFARLQHCGLRPHDSGRYLCARSFEPRCGERELRAGLWTTMLDSDLV